MKKLGLLIFVVLISALMGCSLTVLNSGKEVKEELDEEIKQVENVDNDETTHEDPEQTPVLEDETKNVTDSEDIDSPKEQPNVGTKLDFSILDSLDNTKYSWWFSPNSEHKTPGIPSYAEKLISEHGGIFTGDTSEKVVYLTFDEGYENGYTPQILDTLKENDVKALFFITGSYLDRNPELVKRMVDEGHEVGNHTVSHPSLPDISNQKVENELLELDEKFYSEFGKRFKYLRPPSGEYSQRTLEAAKQLGYKSVFWSFAYKDWDVNDQKGADYAYNKVMDNLHNGAVILLHAVSKDNAEALDRIIKGIKEEGYEIRPFDL